MPKYETRYRWVGTGVYTTSTAHAAHACPAGYYAPPLPSPVWIHVNTGYAATDLASVDKSHRYVFKPVVWERQDAVHDRHKPKPQKSTTGSVVSDIRIILGQGFLFRSGLGVMRGGLGVQAGEGKP